MTDQEIPAPLLTPFIRGTAQGPWTTTGKIPVFSLREAADGTEPIGTHAPGDAGHKKSKQALTDGVGTGVK